MIIRPTSIELFECLINSNIVNDLKGINVTTDALERLDLTFTITYSSLDNKFLEGLTINTLTVKSRTMLPAMRHSLQPLKNLTHLDLTNVPIPDLPDGLLKLTLRDLSTLPVQLSSCDNLKQLNIIHWNVDYIYEGFLKKCVNLKTIIIEFGRNRFTLWKLFDSSNIFLDYLEIHDDPKLLNTSQVFPMNLSNLSFSGLAGVKNMNLSRNYIWSLSK